MPVSQKPEVIQRIFDQLWDPVRNTFIRTIVTKHDVQAAIEWCREHKGSTLSTGNPANFMKDVVRGFGGTKMWPKPIQDLRYTAEQRMGDEAVFEFVPYKPGQTEPFPSAFLYRPGGTSQHEIQSLSVPAVTKQLGRDDETYLIQVAVKLGVVETHFALASPLAGSISEVHHLQVGLKLRKTEIDTMFLATLDEDGKAPQQVLITAEAKQQRQRILEDQIIRQVEGAFEAVPHIQCVLPIAMTSVDQGIYLAEFKRVYRSELPTFTDLELVAEGHYKLVPPVAGIGYKPSRPRSSRRGRGRAGSLGGGN